MPSVPEGSFKEFARKWILPPELFERLIRFRTVEAHKREKADLRRLWRGEPLPALAPNSRLFVAQGLPARTLTYRRESRSATSLASGTTLRLALEEPEAATYRIGFASGHLPEQGAGARVMLDDQVVAELTYLLPEQWHDVIVAVTAGAHRLEIRSTASGPLEVSHPARSSAVGPPRSPSRPRNVVMLMVDSILPDCLGIYGDGREPSATPAIDRYFKDGLVCDNAYSQSEWTYPGLHSMFLGWSPLQHDCNDPNSPGGGMPAIASGSLAECLRDAGYATMGYSAHATFCPSYNSHLGFDRFFTAPHWAEGSAMREIIHQGVVQLEANRAGNNFVFLHVLEGHEPWITRSELGDLLFSNTRVTDPQVEYDSLKRGQGATKSEPRFDAEAIAGFTKRRQARMREVDLALAPLLSYLRETGQDGETLVVLLSDHGYNYLQREQPLLCDTKVHTPLLIKGPGVAGGRYSGLIANNIDLRPNLLALAGVRGDRRDGDVIAPLGGPERAVVISESLYGKIYQAAARTEGWVLHFSCAFDNSRVKIQLLVNARERLFSRADEAACQDRAAEQPEVARRLRAALEEHWSKRPDRLER